MAFRKNNKNVDTIECAATGTGPILYKWEKYQPSNDSWIRPSSRVVDNITLPELIFSVITEEDEGIYRCVVSNYDGSVITDNATITVYGTLCFLKKNSIIVVSDIFDLKCAKYYIRILLYSKPKTTVIKCC